MGNENPEFKEKVFSFLQGKLSPTEENELLHWIKKDRNVKEQFLKEQEALRKDVLLSKNKQLDQQWERLKSKVEGIRGPVAVPATKKTVRLRQVLAIAAAFVFGLLISSIFYFTKPDAFTNGQLAREVLVPFGAKTNFVLPDGSVVWLNSGSKLLFPNEYKGKRTAHLEGEAYFEVAKSRHPFIVSTKFGEVEVLGTSFNIRAYEDDEFQATLVEGSVKINRDGSKPMFLNPGQQAWLLDSNQLQVREVTTDIFTSWKDGRLIFYREPFGKMAKRLEKWYNVNIEIDNEEMKDLWFTGTIEMETFSEVMDLISKSMPVQYSYDQVSRTLKIYKK
jgi:ferric-dicitrate binding protein FerR (iron transport regulator)